MCSRHSFVVSRNNTSLEHSLCSNWGNILPCAFILRHKVSKIDYHCKTCCRIVSDDNVLSPSRFAPQNNICKTDSFFPQKQRVFFVSQTWKMLQISSLQKRFRHVKVVWVCGGQWEWQIRYIEFAEIVSRQKWKPEPTHRVIERIIWKHWQNYVITEWPKCVISLPSSFIQ